MGDTSPSNRSRDDLSSQRGASCSALHALTLLDRLIHPIEQSLILGRMPEMKLDSSMAPAHFCRIKQRIAQHGLRRSKVVKYGSRQFAILLAVISMIYEAISCSQTITKRDIFYRDVPLFGSQRAVDDALSRLSAHLGLERHQLNVRTTAKGLVRGPLTVTLSSGSSLDCQAHDYLITEMCDLQDMLLGDCDAVLVVEKEAVFQTLVSCSLHCSKDFRCLLVTGKGYPDLYTRQFLHMLQRHISEFDQVLRRSTPIVCLVDADPHGVEILATYKFGSLSMSRENEDLTLTSLKWLGIHPSDVESTDPGLIPFNCHDRKKLASLFDRGYISSGSNGLRTWRQELCRMQELQSKAEIEVLAERHGTLKDFVQQRIMQGRWL